MRMEVLAGPERRRRWSDEEKCRIVREAQEPEFAMLMLRRLHDISAAQLYQWRVALREGRLIDPCGGSIGSWRWRAPCSTSPLRAGRAQDRHADTLKANRCPMPRPISCLSLHPGGAGPEARHPQRGAADPRRAGRAFRARRRSDSAAGSPPMAIATSSARARPATGRGGT